MRICSLCPTTTNLFTLTREFGLIKERKSVAKNVFCIICIQSMESDTELSFDRFLKFSSKGKFATKECNNFAGKMKKVVDMRKWMGNRKKVEKLEEVGELEAIRTVEETGPIEVFEKTVAMKAEEIKVKVEIYEAAEQFNKFRRNSISRKSKRSADDLVIQSMDSLYIGSGPRVLRRNSVLVSLKELNLQ